MRYEVDRGVDCRYRVDKGVDGVNGVSRYRRTLYIWVQLEEMFGWERERRGGWKEEGSLGLGSKEQWTWK